MAKEIKYKIGDVVQSVTGVGPRMVVIGYVSTMDKTTIYSGTGENPEIDVCQYFDPLTNTFKNINMPPAAIQAL